MNDFDLFAFHTRDTELRRRPELVTSGQGVINVMEVLTDERRERSVIKIPLAFDRIGVGDAVGRGAAESDHLLVAHPTRSNLNGVQVAVGPFVIVTVAEQKDFRRQTKT